MRLLPLLLMVASMTGCSNLGSKPQVVVVHRCKDVNFDDLSGPFAKVDSGTNVTTKSRFLAVQGGAALELQYVVAGQVPLRLRSDGAGPDRVTFTAVGGSARKVEGRITEDCRVELVDASVPEGKGTFVPFEPAARLDFEPCTERLYLDGAAKSESAARRAPPAPDVPPVTRRSSTQVAAWGPRSEVGPGCKPVLQIWSNGEAEVMTDLKDDGRGSRIYWGYKMSNDFVGLRALSLRRYADCAGTKKLLGVACAEYEVK